MAAPVCRACGAEVGKGGEFLSYRAQGGMVVEDWLCGRKGCSDAYDDDRVLARAEVLEVTGGVPVVRKVRAAGTVRPGELLSLGEGVWRVERVNAGSVDVRCVLGPARGQTSSWCATVLGLRRVSQAEVDEALRDQAETRVRTEDEHRCPNCWSRCPGTDRAHQDPDNSGLCVLCGAVTDGDYGDEDPGRDQRCPDHVVPEAEVRRAVTGKRKREEDPAAVARVLELRAKGMKYHEIEKEMGWPDTKGGRPWRIVKAHEKGEGR